MTRPTLTKPAKSRRWILAGAGAAAIAAAAIAASGAWIRHKTAPYIYRNMAQLPREPVAIVLGAKVYSDGRMSAVLLARVETAVALYKDGKVSKVLMTGDNSSRSYDEVTPMKNYALAAGIPDQNIVRDYAGFRTFDSCYRAKHVFDIDRAVIVTQDFHLPRSVYLARRMGIDAVGFAAPDNMSRRDLRALELREAPAELLAMVDAHSPWKRPHFVGPAEPIALDSAGR